ncbi:META domain-containing protein [Shewanella sp. AS16]|uniref:META domain-containing protein n=1 Tax=Shewanella sp. AS16 TaxID=2907625 RepID=UPI001F290C0C|nr:META domain-containing protein [Shewanella sp. AS16]MCE9685651.1 META domain-containing protein [Shewanella sp. AS16]
MIKQTLFLGTLLLGLSACQSSPNPDVEDLALMGHWHVERILDKAVLDYSPAQLSFAADGSLSGNNSCNNFFGQYQQQGERLTLAPAGTTMKACVDALMAQESSLMQAMVLVAAAELKGDKLALLDAKGRPLLLLRQEQQ